MKAESDNTPTAYEDRKEMSRLLISAIGPCGDALRPILDENSNAPGRAVNADSDQESSHLISAIGPSGDALRPILDVGRDAPGRAAVNFNPNHDQRGRFATSDSHGATKDVFIAQTQLFPRPLNFIDLLHNYPTPRKYPTDVDPSGKPTIWDLIGGKVGFNGKTDPDARNSCAVRLSYALNRGGLPIPYTTDQTSSGSDKMWYFTRVAALDRFIRSQLGAPQELSPADWKTRLAGQTGIIEYEPKPGVFRSATGHFSLFDGVTNVDGPDHDYTSFASRIYFWRLK